MVAAVFGLWSSVYAQQMGSGATAIGAGTIPGTPFGGAVDPTMVHVTEGFQVIPSISVGERYDSNVYFVPKRQVLDREDFVTTTVPQLRGLYVGDSFAVNASASAIGEYYAKNTNLNYVGTNTGIALDASKLLDRWRQGAMLRVTDTYIYTPQAPAFLMGNLAGDNANPYVSGYQVGRANVSSNILKADLSVPLNQTVNLVGSYSNGFIKYTSSEVQQAGALLSSDFQTYTAGLSMKASPQDTLSLNSVNSEYNFTSQPGGSFTTHGGTVGWDRTFTPNVSMRSSAGAQLLQGTFNGVPMSSVIAPVGSLAFLWKDRTTSMTLAYGAAVTPTFQFQSQALLTQTVSLTLTQQTAIPELLAVANLNYGRGDQYGSTSTASISYVSYNGTGGLVYRFSPKTFLGLNYSYSNFDNKFGANTFAFDRQVVQLSLTQAFY